MIDIDDEYAVTTDNYNWILKKKGIKKRKENKQFYTNTYYPSLECLVTALINKRVMDGITDKRYTPSPQSIAPLEDTVKATLLEYLEVITKKLKRINND